MRLIDADKIIYSWQIDADGNRHDGVTLESIIRKMPTIETERPTGHWVEMGQNEDGTHNICCGVCGKFKIKSRGHANSYYTKNKYKFCGGCGCRMMEVEHGSQDG